MFDAFISIFMNMLSLNVSVEMLDIKLLVSFVFNFGQVYEDSVKKN